MENKDKIFFSDDVIAELAGLAAIESYGVVGMSDPSLARSVSRLLSRRHLKKGVKVVRREDNLSIELNVIIEYGVNLVEVAKNLIERVSYEINRHTGLKVDAVEVIVRGIRKE